MLKMIEIKKLDASAINQKVSELRKELFDLRLKRSTTDVEKTHLFATLRKDIARLLTALNSKEASK